LRSTDVPAGPERATDAQEASVFQHRVRPESFPACGIVGREGARIYAVALPDERPEEREERRERDVRAAGAVTVSAAAGWTSARHLQHDSASAWLIAPQVGQMTSRMLML
jgi:hypothetical protein